MPSEAPGSPGVESGPKEDEEPAEFASASPVHSWEDSDSALDPEDLGLSTPLLGMDGDRSPTPSVPAAQASPRPAGMPAESEEGEEEEEESDSSESSSEEEGEAEDEEEDSAKTRLARWRHSISGSLHLNDPDPMRGFGRLWCGRARSRNYEPEEGDADEPPLCTVCFRRNVPAER